MEAETVIEAVKNNNCTTVLTLLQEGLDANLIDGDKRSLLLIATLHGHIDMAKILLRYGALVNQQAENMDSAFLYAGASGQVALLKLYLEHGAAFDVYNRYQGTALIPACERGYIETVRLLAHTKHFPINHINRLGWTGLMEAVILGDGSAKYQEIVQILKEAGAAVDIPDFDGITPLQYAENRGFKEIAALLKD
ncbi:ankyrin repeat domain-containing protein [Sphingobacteriaceae bacterium WQ 2009]|uniref:Ankyrin repeat domain-containing protein n=1 Tax=Rhinopithecimicrobium faecis TaxID=2820698 RepID=A0A8T4H616_9SPHI|nr:ankyrin repeat domain-containing protein [Sphingobacteriaceae bacterium WQ 2009]